MTVRDASLHHKSVWQVILICSWQKWELEQLKRRKQMSYRCALFLFWVSFGLLWATSNIFQKVCSRSSQQTDFEFLEASDIYLMDTRGTKCGF